MECRLLLALVAVISVMTPDMTSGCSCMPEHPQTSYCRADFVMKAHMIRKDTVFSKELVERDGEQVQNRFPSVILYKLHINKVYKDTEAYRNVSRNFRERTGFVYTSASDSTCGVELKNNTKYLISGYVAGKRAYINQCNMIQEWNSVHVRQRKGIQQQYEQSCTCKIRVCSRCRDTSNNSYCTLNRREPGAECYYSQNHCHLHSNGHCKWGNATSFQECVNKAKNKALSEP